MNDRYPSGLHLWPYTLCLTLGIQPLIAQADTEVTQLETIQVEADRAEPAPLGGGNIAPQVIRQGRVISSDSASLLRHHPSVTINETGGVSALPAIHGLADDRLRIKVDGMDLVASCPNHMNPPLSYVDPSDVNALQVFAGVTPVSVGGDSIGGTILAETKSPEFAQPGAVPEQGGEIGLFYRSNNAAVGGNLSAHYATDALSLNYNGSASRADNYTAGDNFKTTTVTGRPGHALALNEVGSTAYETQNHALGLAYRTAQDLLELKLGFQNMDEQLYPTQRMDLTDNEQQRASLSWLRGFDWGDLTLTGYHEQVDHAMDFGPDKRFWYGSQSQPPTAAEPGTPCSPIGFMTCASGMPMLSEARTSGIHLQGEILLDDMALLRVGGELQRYRLDDYWTPSGGGMAPETFLNINNGERDRTALYAELEQEQGSHWTTLMGVRFEQVRSDAGAVQGYKTDAPAPGNQIADAAAFNAQDRSLTDDNLDLSLIARYRPNDSFGMELGAARKVRSPNLYERYTWSTWSMAAAMNNLVGDGNGYVGNVALEPETAHTLSLGLEWHATDHRWMVKATPYYTHIDNYIDAVALGSWATDQFNLLQYQNQSARLYGVDLSGEWQLANNAAGVWRLNGIINATEGENRDTGDELYNIMPLNGRFTLNQQHEGWDNSLEWVLVAAKDRVNDIRNEVETTGYGLLNLRLGHQWQQLRLDLGVENLFDRAYALPTGGTYVGQGSTRMLNGIPWGIAVPGMGRSLYAGVKLSF